ncbi:hypothetical protein [Aggregatibacter kilianii]|nr:hypothetical protein [Aggregatibacter kilianii]
MQDSSAGDFLPESAVDFHRVFKLYGQEKQKDRQLASSVKKDSIYCYR